MSTFLNQLAQQQQNRKEAGLWRCLPKANSQHVLEQGNAADTVIDFTSNDYLGLSQHPEVIKATQQATAEWGAGSTGSRLLSGNDFPLLEAFEKTIAQSKGQEAALLFASGYQANSTVLPSLLHPQWYPGEKPIVLWDRLCHASLVQGVLHSGAHWQRYKPLDMADLEARLQKVSQGQSNSLTSIWIVTESVFSMDGDVSDLQATQQLAEHYGANVFVDEAHATGLLGSNGYGLATTVDWGNVPVVIMGTLSKALGSMGAYVASRQLVIDSLLNHCPGVIYTTAPSPSQIAAAQAAWKLLPSLETQRQCLHTMARQIRKVARDNGWQVGGNETSPIIPLTIGNAEQVLALQKQWLETYGLRVGAIRPPTVPPNTSRLRITVRANHTDNEVARLCTALENSSP